MSSYGSGGVLDRWRRVEEGDGNEGSGFDFFDAGIPMEPSSAYDDFLLGSLALCLRFEGRFLVICSEGLE
jgi:hypothetical protein